MKKLNLMIFLTLWVQMVFAGDFVTIKGKVNSGDWEHVELFQVREGKPVLYASTQVAADGSFAFLLKVEQSEFYTIGSQKESFVVYVQPEDEINVSLGEHKLELEGKNSKENQALYRWEEYAYDVWRQSACFQDKTIGRITYKEFYPEFSKFLAGIPDMEKTLKTGNEVFDKLLVQKIKFDMDYYALTFFMTPRLAQPQKDELHEYYATIVSPDKFTTENVLLFPYGSQLINTYVSFANYQNQTPMTSYDEFIETSIGFMGCDKLKGEIAVTLGATLYKTYEQYAEGMRRFNKYLVDNSLKERAAAIGSRLYQVRAGQVAADFTGKDVNGKEVSLSDFKGKVVLVDVWATWCGPCRGEIPHLKRLEEEMKDSGVVFLGVSIDELKDTQEWKDFVKTEDLRGIQIQVSGGFNSSIVKDYQIKGIPRFMVIDKKGNVANLDAPRPSSSDLKKLLEAELKK